MIGWFSEISFKKFPIENDGDDDDSWNIFCCVVEELIGAAKENLHFGVYITFMLVGIFNV